MIHKNWWGVSELHRHGLCGPKVFKTPASTVPANAPKWWPMPVTLRRLLVENQTNSLLFEWALVRMWAVARSP